MTELTRLLAAHAAHFPADGVSAPVADALALNLADGLAAIIGGSDAPGVGAVANLLAAQSASGEARRIAAAGRYPAIVAAQINATAGHALDFDDTLDEGGGMHAGALVHSAALAVADELGGVSGAAYTSAVSVGLDIAVRLALSATQDFGWHRTSAFGVFGVVGAVGRLLKLTQDEFVNAFGIAYSQASGNRQCIADGALSKRLQAGFAARDGIIAVQLARAGLTGASRAFEGTDGFFNLYQRGAFDPQVILGGLGETLLSDRISLKPYPCGRNLHALLDAVFAARARHEGRVIDRIEVFVPERAARLARTGWPAHVVEAQFSVPFVVALATAEGHTELLAFDAPDTVSDAVRALADKVSIHAREGAESDRIAFHYEDGTPHIEQIGATALGHPSRPLAPEAVRTKLRSANRFSGVPIDEGTLDRIFDLALVLPSLSSTRQITDALNGQTA